MTTQLILNPSSGANRALSRIHAALPTLKRAWPELDIRVSESAAHVTQLARRAADRGDEVFFVAGGDGTVHFAANGLAGTDTALGVLPVGTGNDIAQSVGLPRGAASAAEVLAMRHVHAMDLGRVADRVFCCVLGVGMDTPALRRINGARVLRRGRLLYTLATLETLVRYAPPTIRLAWGDVRMEQPTFFAAVTNTRSYAGGMRITPDALVGDGLLDVCVFPQMNPVKMLRAFSGIFSGAHARMSEVRLDRCEAMTIACDQPLPITLDGELTDLRTDVEVRVWPGALKILGDPAAALVGEPGPRDTQRAA